MREKRQIPRVRTATSEYDSLLSYVERRYETSDEMLEFFRSFRNIERILDEYEAEANEVLERAGHSPGSQPEPLTDAAFAVGVLRCVAGARKAIKDGDAANAAWYGIQVERQRTNALIRAMEVNYRIGEKHRKAPGVSKAELSAMQAAANEVWRRHPRMSASKVAEQIAPQFPKWEVGTIRKKIRRPA